MTTLDPERIPQHIAIIMDGNGRWAKARGLDRSLGHQEGAATVRDITEEASNLGVKFLTLEPARARSCHADGAHHRQP